MTDYLAFIEENCLDLRCVDEPTGGDDADVVWVVIEHHMAPPRYRDIGLGYSPKEALDDAIKRIHVRQEESSNA